MPSANATIDAKPPQFEGAKLALATFMISIAAFAVVLNTSSCNVAVPTISAALAVSPHEGAWVITSYAVADAITVPLSGWLAARFGMTRVVCLGMALFALASFVCGLVTSLPMLVLARIVQGLAGGPVIPLSQAMILDVYPTARRGFGLAVWSTTNTLGPVVGSLLGGYACEYLNWRWLFWLNVPIALIVALVLWQLMKGRDAAPRKIPVDVIGFCLMALWIGCLQMALDRGHDLDWLESPFIIGLVITTVIGFIAFLIWELTEEHPIVDLWVLRNRGFTIGTGVLCVAGAAFFGSVVLSPLWLQSAMGYTQSWAALTSLFVALVGVVGMPTSAWLMTRIDSRIMIFCGLLIMAMAFMWRAQFNSQATFELVVLTQIAVGVGMSLSFAPAISMALNAVSAREVAGAAGILSFARAASIGFAAAYTITTWQDGMTVNRVGIVDRLPLHAGVGAMGTAGLPQSALPWQLDYLVQDQAVMLATNDAYMFFAAVAAVSAFIVWLAPSPRRKKDTGGPTPPKLRSSEGGSALAESTSH